LSLYQELHRKLRERVGSEREAGLAITEILPLMSLFAKGNRYGLMKQTVLQKRAAPSWAVSGGWHKKQRLGRNA